MGFNPAKLPPLDKYEPNTHRYLTKYPIAVDCWFPTGTESKPKILQFKIKDDDGEIVTINRITIKSFESTFKVMEFHCEITYLYTKREVVIFFFPEQMKWELSFLS